MGVMDSIRRKLNKENLLQLKQELLWLLGAMSRYRGAIAIVSLLSLAGSLMGLASSVASKYLVDAVTGYGTQIIGSAALIMVCMMLGSVVLQAFSSWVGARVNIRVRNGMQLRTYGKILRASWQSLEAYRSGDLLNRLNSDINAVSGSVISFLPSLLASGAKFLGAFLIMLFYDPVMALIAMMAAPLTLVLSALLVSRLRRHNLIMKELGSEVMSFQEESFWNLTSIKAFSAVDRYESEMDRIQQTYADAYLGYNTFRISMSSLLSLLSMGVTAGCFGWGVYQLWQGNITYGSMTMFLQLSSVLRGSFSSLVSLAQQIISVATSAGRIAAVEDLPSENTRIPEGFSQEADFRICLQNILFRYQDGDTLLNSFDFTALPGDQIAVIGPSGEGKTTLLRLLLGLVEPCKGTAELQGSSGRSYPICAGTRSVFAYVPQGNSIFTGTIAQNLRIVSPDATEAEMEQALKTACAWDFVSQFPDGIHHHLGAGGRGVSEGQAQRLAIARALLCKAPILLLDEATSGLDVATERKLIENLRKSGLVRTCILVTHRPGSTEFCTRTYEVSHGNVTEVRYGA